MKTRINKLVYILNVIISIVFILPIFKLNLFSENYSTLSLYTEGYLYVLFLGISTGLLLAYETLKINSKKYAIIIFLSMLVGVIIPHHIPYNLQGNLHLLFAYIGSSITVLITIININKNILIAKKIQYFFYLSMLASICIYLKCAVVNTLSEVILMLSILLTNLYIFININIYQ